MYIYVNGELKDSKETAISSVYITDIPLIIGTNYNLQRFFGGFIDESYIYNRALSAEEIKRHYEMSK
jgi:hypothetical protein